jgi:hypothetical protein
MPKPEGSRPLRPDEVLIRGIQKNKLVWDHQKKRVVPSLANFKLRPQEAGLSVERKAYTTLKAASQKGRFECFVEFTCAEIAGLSLTVRPKKDPDNPKKDSVSGAEIFGLPPYADDDAAEEWADRLRSAARWTEEPSPEIVEYVKRKSTSTA